MKTNLCLAMFLVISRADTDNSGGNDISHDHIMEVGHDEDGECYENAEASWVVRKWVLTEVPDDETIEKHKFSYYDTDLTLVRDEVGPAWYIAGGGWEGVFYYETGGEPGEERAGAYLYPDYTTAVVGVWRDHLLLSGRTTELGMACRAGSTWTLWFGELEGPSLAYSPPSHYSLGIQPLQR